MADNALSPPRDPETGQFLQGYSGNPNGRPLGARAKLGEAFLQALQEDFDEFGVAAIAEVRKDKPDQYLKVIASLLPKDVNLTVNNDIEMTDDELRERIRKLSDTIAPFLAGAGSADSGVQAQAGDATPSRVH